MARTDRFVEPETATLELSDGDWVQVKRRLSYGEQQRLAGVSIRGTRSVREPTQNGTDATAGVDWERFQIERLHTWLADWSFLGADRKPVALTREAIRTLDPATVREIDAALTTHVAAEEERGKARSEPISVDGTSP